MRRSTVEGASCVCRVAKTRWPVSAAVSAVPIVSRSRISPRRITSGSWRSAPRRASAKLDRVGADLALVDDAALVPVEELDRVLDGHDVVVARAVDLVDHRRERGRLARAGRARDEDEAARLRREVLEDRRKPELLERLQLGRDQAEGRAEALALEVDVDAEAREAGDRVGDVDLALRLEVLLLLGGEDAVEHPLRVLGAEAGELVEALEAAVDADDGLGADRDVQVRGAAHDNLLEQVVDRSRRLSLARGRGCGRRLRLRGGLANGRLNWLSVGSIVAPDGCYRQGGRLAKGGCEIPRTRGRLRRHGGRYLPLSHCTLYTLVTRKEFRS